MKRLQQIFTALLFLCFFTGCINASNYIHPSSIHYNYNNITANESGFWFTEDSLFYATSPFYAIRYYRISESGKTNFASAATSAFGRIQVSDNTVYMLDFVDNPDVYTSTYHLRSYDPDTQSITEIGRFENVVKYVVFQDRLYYTQEHLRDNPYHLSLHMYDLKTKNDICLSELVFGFGVMGETVVALVQDGPTFTAYSYNGEFTEFGSFHYDVSQDKELREDIVNFTDNHILLTASGYDSSDLVCFDVSENISKTYTIDGYVDSVVAYDDYAFVVKTDEVLDDKDKEKNTIMRMRLSDGSTQTITQIQGDTTMYVDSDERVFIQTHLNNHIYCYSVNGEKTLVYKG